MTSHSINIRNASNYLVFLGLGLCATAHAYSPNDIIATYAGNATQGYSGDGGPAVSANLSDPTMMALDAAGNLYISDYGSSTIRKVSTSGIITTIAGTGVAGYNGDGIAATTAQLNNPRGIAFDAAGNLFVAEAGNERIRMIAAGTGVISTAAGTGAQGCNNDVPSKATFNAPLGLAFDSVGTLYISEAGNRIVRKLSGGLVSSFAGTCSQTAFQLPWGLTTDSSGYVYVVDNSSKQVFKVDSSGNQILFAGSGSAGNTGDGSLATAAGVSLNNPNSVAIDSVGNTYIGSGNVVRVVTPDGIIHTSTGNGTSGNTGDGALASIAELNDVAGLSVNTVGRLFIADDGSAVVRIVGPAAPVTIAVAEEGAVATGDSIASADGRINCPGTCGGNYVNGMPVIFDATPTSPDPVYQWTGAACSGNAACTITPHTSLPTSITGRFTPWYIKTLLGGTVGPSLQRPFGLTFDAQGNLYFTETTDCVVRKRSANFTLTTVAGNGVCGDLGDGIPATEAELNYPQAVAVDATGDVFVQDNDNGKIRKITPDGILHTFIDGIFTGSERPAMTLNSNGELFALKTAGSVIRVDANGNSSLFFSMPTTFRAIAAGDNGQIVIRTDSDFLEVGDSGVIVNDFIYPKSLPIAFNIFYRNRNIYLVGNCSVTEFSVESLQFSLLITPQCGYAGDGGPASGAKMFVAQGIAIDQNGWLYIADYGNNAIRELYPDAIFTGNMEQ